MTRRNRSVFFVAATLAAVATVLVPLAASATDGHRLMISERNQLTSFDPATGSGTQSGTWDAAGAVNDEGTVDVTFTVVPDGDGKGILSGTHVLTSPTGTITIETRAFVRPFPPPARAMAEGQWEVAGATGAYAGLSGRGKIYATADFTDGEITIVRDGMANG
jgi:hypothetical protein